MKNSAKELNFIDLLELLNKTKAEIKTVYIQMNDGECVTIALDHSKDKWLIL